MKKLRILIVGGGIGGMSAAIALARDGHEIELVDLDPQWRVYGAGITITGPTLRAYRRLGLLDEIKKQGAITNGARIFNYDGAFLHKLDEPVLEEGLPATGGIMRPILHRIMQKSVAALAVNVRLGLTVDTLAQTENGVDVRFSDMTEGSYDIVVGADGVFSRIRSLAFSDAVEPVETGQACWRISMQRPPGFDRTEFFFGHANPAGVTACGPDNIYMWMLTPHQPGSWLKEDDAYQQLKSEIAPFGGTIGWIRDHMSQKDWINYRPLSALLQPASWVAGRVVLLGDAAHATTPHLASGAGMAVEDGLVLAEEVSVLGRDLQESLEAYSQRRFPRCADVVRTSIAVGRLQLAGAPPQEVGGLISSALHRLAQDF